MNDSNARKATPIYSGVLRYFPDALAAVARLSKAGNDKHNPGEPLHWSRGKSDDHGDCLIRHQLTPDAVDPETGELHAAAVAWRALAQLQLLEEGRAVENISVVTLSEFDAFSSRADQGLAPFMCPPGTHWERGTGEPPAWAKDGLKIEYRHVGVETTVTDFCDGQRDRLGFTWFPHYEYRIAQ